MIFEGAMSGIKFALGENPKRPGNPSGQRIGAGNVNLRYPATRMGVEDVIREAFTEAKAYQASWKEYNDKLARGEPAVAPRRDLKLEPLMEVLEGKRFVHAHCYRADEILLLRVANEFSFKIRTLQHVLEGYKVAKEIAEHGAGASTFSDWWSFKLEAFDAIPYNAAIMMRKGVLVSLNSDSDELIRHLNDEAAKTMKYGGLTETEALSTITINPAKQLAIDNSVGSIEVGKAADLAIFDKHPLSNYAKVEKVYIDGQIYFDRNADLAERPSHATQKEEVARPGKGTTKKNRARREQEASSMKSIALAFLFVLPLAAGPDDTFLIRGATVHPVASAEIENGSVLVRDGKIIGIGRNLTVPKGIRIVEGKGLHLYPGMIDSGTQIGLSEISSTRESVDTGELGKFDPQLRAEIAINPASEHIPVTRANGITSVITLPLATGEGGGRRGAAPSIIAGQTALVNLDEWTWEEMDIKQSAGMALRIPTILPPGGRRGDFQAETGTGRGWFTDAKKNYDNDLRELRDFFEQARRYQKAKSANEKGFRPDLKLEAVLPVLEGKSRSSCLLRGNVPSAMRYSWPTSRRCG